MPDAYATPDDLTNWLPSTVTVESGDVARLLNRASELMDSTVRSPFSVDTNGIPTVTAVASAMRDATCAQVEQWLEVGEENDIDGLAGTSVQIGGAGGYTGYRATEVAPRAFRILQQAGLLGLSVQMPSADAEFFDTTYDEVLP